MGRIRARFKPRPAKICRTFRFSVTAILLCRAPFIHRSAYFEETTMTSETYSDASVAEAQHPDNAARNSLVINLLLVSAFVVMLNETIMNVAIPTIRDS